MSESANSSLPRSVRYDDQLAEYQIRTEAMLNSLGEGLIVVDDHGAVTMINAYALKALGFDNENEVIGKWLPKSIVAVDQHGNPLDTMARPIIRAVTTGQTVNSYAHYITKHGSYIPVHITVSPIIINGTPTGAIEVFRDLTKEQQLDVAKDEFVSLASHQLRTPATGVKSILAMLANGDFGDVTPVQRKYIEKAIQSNNRQLQVIEDLLNVALVDAGKMELDVEYIELCGLIRDVITDYSSTIESRQQTIELIAPQALRLIGDAQKLRMALDNLIGNASKYSTEGGHVKVEVRQEDDDAVLCVSDEGVGIAANQLPNIFTKFTRLPNEMSSKVGGTGLGLFLTKNIIELHRGSLAVESQEGIGSTFFVRLPTKWSSTA